MTVTGGWIVDGVTPVPDTPRTYRRTVPVPTVAALRAEGLIAPSNDPYRYFDHRERRTAQWLTVNGVQRLRSVRRGHGYRRRTPDGIFDHGDSVATIEMKAPTSTTADGIRRNVRVGTEQSRIVVLDYRAVALDLATAIDGLRRAIRQNGADLEQLILMLGEGSLVGWKP